MVSTIDKNISRLLFEHECVILPEFGAFITRHYPAEVNTTTHMLRPASKRVSFNPSIKDNDGLLAKHISVSESITYNQALNSISISIRSWKRILKSGKKVNLPGIGRLYLDNDSKIQFNPAIEINYDRSSYGLNIFRSAAIQKELEVEKVIHQAIEKHIPSKTVKEKERRLMPMLFRAAVVTAFVGLSITAGVYYGSPKGLNAFSGLDPYSLFSSFNNDAEKVAADEKIVSEVPVIENTTNKSVISPDKIETPIKEKASEQTAVNNLQEAIDTETSIPTATSNPYHIVVGSFKEKNNAERYALNLRTKGYDAYVADGDTRFSRVAVGNYTNSIEAKKALLTIKNEINSGAWVYSN